MMDLPILKPLRGAEAPCREQAMVAYLKSMVVDPPEGGERFHAVFLDPRRSHLFDARLGHGRASGLHLRMRELFTKALAVDASGIVIAHNHPSGDCRPSSCDIDATNRLNRTAKALDIELLDHLIFSRSAVYSMRAGGML